MEEGLVQGFRCVQNRVIHLAGGEPLLKLRRVSAQQFLVPFPQLAWYQGKLLPRLHVPEVRRPVEGELQLVRVQEVEHDHIVSWALKEADGFHDLLSIFIEIANENQNALSP